jgi:peptidoglycan/xylan/chitin deacetylase (PgdA/CDA1 family)
MSTFAPVLLTSWDDGTVTDVRMAELLTRYGFRGTFFATTGPEERETASTEELRAIVRLGHEIGNHGVSHRSLTGLSTAAIVEDAHLGAELCETFMRTASPIVAPPRGHLDDRVLATLHQETLLVRTAPIVGRARPAAGTVEPTVHLFAHSLYRTVGHLLRRRAVPAAGLVRPLLAHRELWSRMAAILRVYARATAPLHIWGHSEEVERFQWWDRLESLLSLARDLGYHGATLGEFYCGTPPDPRHTGPSTGAHAR